MEILFKKHPTFSEAVMASKVKHGGLHLLCYKQNFKDLSKVKRVKNWKWEEKFIKGKNRLKWMLGGKERLDDEIRE